MHVRVKDVLSPDASAVPADVVAVRRETIVHPSLDTIQELEARGDLRVGQIENCLSMGNGDDYAGMPESALKPLILQEQHEVVFEDYLLLRVTDGTVRAVHRLAAGFQFSTTLSGVPPVSRSSRFTRKR